MLFADNGTAMLTYCFQNLIQRVQATRQKNNEAVEGEYIEYSCERIYKANVTAKMQWRELSSGEDIKAKDESSKGTVKFTIVVEIKPSHNGESFTCQTYFDKPQSRDHYANNIPINNNAFNETFSFRKLSVYCKY